MHQNLPDTFPDPVIRMAGAADMEAVLALVHELAAYEQARDKVTATAEIYREAFADGYFHTLVAEVGGEIVGIALYYRTFSTWKGRMMYLEDLVVREEFRGNGIGKLLFDAFLEKARESNSVLCKWQVLYWNAPAIRFYKRYETVFDEEWVDVKLFL